MTAVMLGLVVPAGAGAASKPPPPESNTTCWGSLKATPAAGEPNLLAYQFQCDTPITAYTIIVNRRPWDLNLVDDFDTAPLAVLSDGITPDPNTSWTCEGAIPTNGFNCNAGAGGSMAAWSWAQGSFDTSDPYCGVPAAAKPLAGAKRAAKKAQQAPLPRALAQLVVSDSTGAEDGPFVLSEKGSCRIKTQRKHHNNGRRGK